VALSPNISSECFKIGLSPCVVVVLAVCGFKSKHQQGMCQNWTESVCCVCVADGGHTTKYLQEYKEF
jgi:hypothetical protein